MKNAQPLFNTATHYRIELEGRVDLSWLQNFDGSAEVEVHETWQMEVVTVLNVHTDQSGMVGLMRRLHGLGMTILKLQIVSNERKDLEVEEQL